MANNVVQNQASQFFDPQVTSGEDLVTLQIDPTAPVPSGLSSATSMLLPNVSVRYRMRHFPENLYDLDDSSHLMRFMKVLLGESGGGQLRKRNLISTFQNAPAGAHFYDIDSFYGAIFNVSRTASEALGKNPVSGAPFDPSTDTAIANEWDAIHNADSHFRQRLFQLARAINMGGTLPGIKAAAEAIIQAPVDVLEVWDLVDRYGGGSSGRTWAAVEGLGTGTWGSVETLSAPQTTTWGQIESILEIGLTGTNSRAEVVLIPRKNYDLVALSQDDATLQRQRQLDTEELLRVLKVIKPANVLLTVDTTARSLVEEIPIAAMDADSSFWYIATTTTPDTTLTAVNGVIYPVSNFQLQQGIGTADAHEIPKPPWALQEQAKWSYTGEIVSVSSYVFDGFETAFGVSERDSVLQANGYAAQTGTYTIGSQMNIISPTDDAVVVYQDQTREVFNSNRALIDSAEALATRYSSEGIMSSGAYSAPRQASAADNLLPAVPTFKPLVQVVLS